MIEHYGIKKFEGSGYGSKCFLIREVIKKFNLSFRNSNEIIDFIFSIGTYFKHGTYFKWYYKQMKRIEIFEQYSSNTFDENLILLLLSYFIICKIVALQKLQTPSNNTIFIYLILLK